MYRNSLLAPAGQLHDNAKVHSGSSTAVALDAQSAIATRRLGLNKDRQPLDTTKFRHPPRTGDQLSLTL